MVTRDRCRAEGQQSHDAVAASKSNARVPFTLAGFECLVGMLRIHVLAVDDNQVDLVAYGQGAASALSRVAQQRSLGDGADPGALLHYRYQAILGNPGRPKSACFPVHAAPGSRRDTGQDLFEQL